jgi:DNA-directed RNA polymerase III subunit RPC4
MQPSFLQQAVHIDIKNKRLNVLGDVGRRFVVTPELDTLLSAMTAFDSELTDKLDDETLIRMDTV